MTDSIVLETDKIQATLDVATLKITVLDKAAGRRWETADSSPHDLGYRIGEDSFETSFADGHARHVSRDGERSHRVAFPELNAFVGFALNTARDDEIIVTLGEFDGGGRALPMAGSYPRCFEVPVSPDAYTLLPRAMGIMIPGDWDGRVRTTFDCDCLEPMEGRLKRYADIFRDGKPTYWWDIHDMVDQDVTKFAGGAILNMYCAKAGKSAFLCLVPTRFDWQVGGEHDPGQPTRVRHYWVPSMQRLRYDRVVHYRFCPGAGYVEMAKQYRDWLIGQGTFRTLKEKLEENPHLDGARGGFDAQLHFLSHDVRRKRYQVVRKFGDGIELVQDLKNRSGLEKAIVTVRGWQKWGHDHHYPSLLPPNIDCGGYPEFQRLAQSVRDLGYHFELAGDNYHDIAYDSPDFSEKVVILLPDGTYNRYNMWGSGMTSYLALPWSYKFLRRNFELGKMDYPQTEGLLKLVPFDYYWIGNWGQVNREDYNPECLMDRTEHHRWVLRILNYIRSCGKVLDMEHSAEWCAPYLDRVKNRTPAIGKPNQDARGGDQGVCVPLWSLVFHDSTVIRMQAMHWLRELLYTGIPKVGLPLRDDFESSGQLDRLKIQTRVHERAGFEEMTGHAYLDADHTRERCEYASGVAVEVDYAAGTYKIEGHADFDGTDTPVPSLGG